MRVQQRVQNSRWQPHNGLKGQIAAEQAFEYRAYFCCYVIGHPVQDALQKSAGAFVGPAWRADVGRRRARGAKQCRHHRGENECPYESTGVTHSVLLNVVDLPRGTTTRDLLGFRASDV